MIFVVVSWTIVNLISLGRETESILSENYRSIRASDRMLEALSAQNRVVFRIYMGFPGDHVSEIQDNDAMFYEWYGRATDNITIPGEASFLHSIDSLYSSYSNMLPIYAGNTDLYGDPDYAAGILSLSTEVAEECGGLRALNEETMYSASNRTRDVARRAVWSTIVLAVVIAVFSLIFSYVLAERIVKPVRMFVSASQRISSGDYSVSIPVDSKDELGLLAGEFNKMAKKLEKYNHSNLEKILLEKKKSEAILRGIEDGLVILDSTLSITGINPAARKMLGVGETADSDLRVEDILRDSILEGLLRETIENGKPPDMEEEKRIIGVGKPAQRYVLFSISLIKSREDVLLGLILLLRDVTRLRRVEQMKTDFVMAASHELKSPLTSLEMSVDLLSEKLEGHSSDNISELLQAASEEIMRMKAIVSDLLDLSKIEAGKIELDLAKVKVEYLFEKSVKVFKNQMEEKGVSIEWEVPDGTTAVNADPNKAVWIITNLISNSLRYVTDDGEIRLSARPLGRFVHISVSDNGSGIPLKYQAKIFEKFAQVKSQNPGGTGLGLAICKEIVRAHKGTIWVDSSPGKGSTFTFTLPRAD